MNDSISDSLERAEIDSREKVFRELVPSGPKPLFFASSGNAVLGPLAVLIAILPGLYGLTHWDLTPPGPWWGLRGLAVYDDQLWLDQSSMADAVSGRVEYSTLRRVALQPPLYAWLEAGLLAVSPSRSPLTAVLPSYMFGVLMILGVYLQGRTWSKSGSAIFATWVFAFHQHTLDTMQRAGPATLGAAAIIAAIHFYSLHILAGQDGRIRGRIHYAMGCGACLGISLMSVGLLGLMLIAVIGFHQVALNAGESPMERPRYWYEAWRVFPGLFYGSAAISVALLIAAPWHVWMTLVHNSDFWLSLVEPTRPLGLTRRGPLGYLVEASPVLLGLALYSAWVAIRYSISPPVGKLQEDQLIKASWVRERLNDFGPNARNGLLLWTIWAVVAVVLSLYWPMGPQNTMGLLLAAPLSLLAGHALRGLAQRQVSAKILIWTTPLTCLSLLWKYSIAFRSGFRVFQQKFLPDGSGNLRVFEILLMVAGTALSWLILKWVVTQIGHRRSLSRLILGLYLFSILTLQTGLGIKVLSFRHTITRQLLDLREAIVRRNLRTPLQEIYVVGSISQEDLARMRPDLIDPDPLVTLRVGVRDRPNSGIDPAGRLRFILHTALPRVPQSDLDSIEALFDLPSKQRLVIVVGKESRVSIADQSRLGLEPIHPGVSNILTAFATSKTSVSSGARLSEAQNPRDFQPPGVLTIKTLSAQEKAERQLDQSIQLISIDEFSR
ncbi:MAG: hypothetical protein RJA81_1289 [Planctomycetota bacterium]|jgi:hypothetical protein